MRLFKIITLLCMILTPVLSSAQVPEQPQEPQEKPADSTRQVQINQPFESKSLGTLTLPFMWDASENEQEQRLVVTETRTHAPAVITIDLISIPQSIDESAIANSIVQSAAKQLNVAKAAVNKTEEKAACDKKKCPKLTFYKADFTGSENGVNRRCALSLLPVQGKMLVFTMCAAASQTYTPDLPEILDQLFKNMQ